MLITFRRIIKSGIKTFLRNGFLSASSILVITITLVTIMSVYFAIILLQSSIKQVEEKVDVNIYFKYDAPVDKVLAFKETVEGLPQVDKDKSNFLSKDKVLEEFKNKHKDDLIILKALDIVDGNPMGAILNIKAKQIGEYSEINKLLGSQDIQLKYGDIVDHSNFQDNKKAIERLDILIQYVKKIGLIISGALVIISLVVTFNTMRLIIYTFKEEISVMRLVGASKFFARGPFVIEGMIYGVISAFFALFSFWAIVYYMTPILEPIFQTSMNQLFSNNIFQIIGALVAGGVGLGFVSTYLSVSKYLKI